MKNIGVISLGCAKNRVDTEMMLGTLTSQGFVVTNKIKNADILIINTCGFIDTAKEESINTILELAEYKKDGICEKLIVMGCLSQGYGKELIKEIPEIDFVVGSGDFAAVSNILASSDKTQKRIYVDKPSFIYKDDVKRVLTTPAGSAYVKIAEGCSSKCSFCAIPKLRGPYNSRRSSSILKEIEYLADKGIKEINLIAQDTTAYARDLGVKDGLITLIREIAGVDGIEWIRLLYCHSSSITKDLISLFQQEWKLCKYIDIPLQHSHNTILRAMRRSETESKIRDVIRLLRSNIPDISLRTTFMVGFPGESDDHFKHLCDFIEEMRFDHLGVFQFSREDGTPASDLPNGVNKSVKEKRYRKIMEIQKRISLENNKKKTGNIYPVLIEETANNGRYMSIGRTSQQAPEIDGTVLIHNRELNVGDILPVRITDALEYDLLGEKVTSS